MIMFVKNYKTKLMRLEVLNMEYSKEIENMVEKFFKLRFPEKDIKFEKECGYFYEWCERFKNGTHIAYSDLESKKVWVSL